MRSENWFRFRLRFGTAAVVTFFEVLCLRLFGFFREISALSTNVTNRVFMKFLACNSFF